MARSDRAPESAKPIKLSDLNDNITKRTKKNKFTIQ